MIVHDDSHPFESLDAILRPIGCDVDLIAERKVAAWTAGLRDYRMVILSLGAADAEGIEAIRSIRRIHSASILPIIVVSASEDPETAVKAFEAGANDILRQPLQPTIASARIKTHFTIAASQRHLRDSEERYALVTRGSNDGVWDWNLVTGHVYVSPRWREMLAIEDPNWCPVKDNWMNLVHEEDREGVYEDLERHFRGDVPHFETEMRMRVGRDSFRWMLCRGLAVRDSHGIAYRMAGSLSDITEGKVADALTGLPNRSLFRDRVDRCIDQYKRRSDRTFAVMYLDIDGFKKVNDQLGHEAGDQFLIQIARRLEESLRTSEVIVARIGGDEFAVLIENLSGLNDAVTVANRIDCKMRLPFPIDGREILSRASIGIAMPPHMDADLIDDDANVLAVDAELLLSHADTAMYIAKQQTECAHSVFDKSMSVENAKTLELGGELRHAIVRNQLSLRYQAIVGVVGDMRTVGFEALLRWHHPVHGEVPPFRFIPIAESNGLIVEIGHWVLGEACRQAVAWRQQHGCDVMVSVNVSLRQLTHDNFVPSVIDVLHETGLDPKLLKLEVTESFVMENPARTIELLHRLRAAGITIGIDDFGTGYSSLAYLHQMPLDILKIDRSFVSSMLESKKHVAIIRSVLALAESLDLHVIAEGVETVEQLQRLRELGCQMVQGYLFSKPILADDAAALIDRQW